MTAKYSISPQEATLVRRLNGSEVVGGCGTWYWEEPAASCATMPRAGMSNDGAWY